jgi:hypothetical protein
MLLVIGGQASQVGKTALAAGLIRRLRAHRWTAIKITQHGQGGCANTSETCECAPDPDHPYALTEEYEPGDTDSGRYLAAGADRSFWLRTPGGRLFESAALVRKIIDQSANTIIESNSILEFFDPDLFLAVLDYAREDFKLSMLRFLDRADACVVADHGLAAPIWQSLVEGLWDDKPRFAVKPPRYVNAEVLALVNSRLSSPAAHAGR